jgi:hemoglobin-like flavoprotein
MNSQDISLIRETFAIVAPFADQAAALFYRRLFELDPSLRPLFRGDLVEQGRKLMQTLAWVVRGLDRLDELLPAVRALGIRHGGYGVKPAHYYTVGDALLWTLAQGLGRTFTPEVEAAWLRAYTTLADVMQAAAIEPTEAAA